MAYARAVLKPPDLGSIGSLSWKFQASKASIILSIFVSIVFLALAIGIYSMACAGAGVSSLGIAGRFATTGICGSGTPGGIESGETPGEVRAPAESRGARALAVAHLSKTCFRSWLYLNVEGSLGSRSSFITAFALKSLGRAPSNISTCEYSAKAPLLIIMRLMLS